MPADRQRVLTRTLIYGAISAILYLMLYLYNEEILARSRQGEWNFLLPLLIALLFSTVHGNFTGQFWELFGIRAKSTKK